MRKRQKHFLSNNFPFQLQMLQFYTQSKSTQIKLHFILLIQIHRKKNVQILKINCVRNMELFNTIIT